MRLTDPLVLQPTTLPSQCEGGCHAGGERKPWDDGGLYRVIQVRLARPDCGGELIAGIELVVP
jgi:hypothetical protein